MIKKMAVEELLKYAPYPFRGVFLEEGKTWIANGPVVVCSNEKIVGVDELSEFIMNLTLIEEIMENTKGRRFKLPSIDKLCDHEVYLEENGLQSIVEINGWYYNPVFLRNCLWLTGENAKGVFNKSNKKMPPMLVLEGEQGKAVITPIHVGGNGEKYKLQGGQNG